VEPGGPDEAQLARDRRGKGRAQPEAHDVLGDVLELEPAAIRRLRFDPGPGVRGFRDEGASAYREVSLDPRMAAPSEVHVAVRRRVEVDLVVDVDPIYPTRLHRANAPSFRRPASTLRARCGRSAGFEIVKVPPNPSGNGRGSRTWSSVALLNAREACTWRTSGAPAPFPRRKFTPSRGDHAEWRLSGTPAPSSSR